MKIKATDENVKITLTSKEIEKFLSEVDEIETTASGNLNIEKSIIKKLYSKLLAEI